jgi:adenine/guanine phosphoribosyltransferase-like PRPP-binding protein
MWEQNRHNSGSASQNEDDEFKKYIREIKDWPKPGVTFRDITPLLRKGNMLSKVIDKMAHRFQNEEIALIASVEARGFMSWSVVSCRSARKGNSPMSDSPWTTSWSTV